jgi:exodeoxyribonuclease-5
VARISAISSSRTAEDRARWLYTAITRAERGLVLLD